MNKFESIQEDIYNEFLNKKFFQRYHDMTNCKIISLRIPLPLKNRKNIFYRLIDPIDTVIPKNILYYHE